MVSCRRTCAPLTKGGIMTWEPCLDEPCCPPLTSGGGMTVPEVRPVKICSDKVTIRDCVKLLCDCTVHVAE